MKRRLGALLAALWLAAAPSGAQGPADCNENGALTIAELITAVNILIGARPLADCPAADLNRDGRVRVNEIILAVGGAGPAPTPTATPGPEDQLPPVEADALATWLEEGRYLAWAAESAPHPGAGPHFGRVRTFVNDVLFTSLAAQSAQHPAGAAAVKELYGNSGDTVRGWAVMTKLQTDSDDGRGWYWYEAYGTFASGGIGLSICTGCHADGRDYVRIPFPLQ